MSKSRLVAALALAMMFVESSIAVAQLTNTPSPLEPSDTSSVRATLHSFIDACNELYDLARSTDSSSDVTVRLLPAFERIRDCLDLSAVTGDLRDSMGVESAIFLKEVLDRIELPEYDAIPGFSAGEEELVVNWRVPGTRITIQRVEVGPQDQPFLFTAESVRRTATSYGVAKELPYRSEGPRTSPGLRERYLALTKRQPTLSEDTSSPRGTLTLFLDKAQDVFELTQSARYLDRSDPELVPLVSQVYGCLDLSELPEYTRDHYAGEAAVCLKEVLDRTALPSIEAIPGPENLQASDANEPLARWQIPSTRISIVRMTEGPQRGKYLFNTETVGGAVAMYESVKDQPYRSDGPPVSPGLHDWFLSVPSNATVGALRRSLTSILSPTQARLGDLADAGIDLCRGYRHLRDAWAVPYWRQSERCGTPGGPLAILAQFLVRRCRPVRPFGVQTRHLGGLYHPGNSAVRGQLYGGRCFPARGDYCDLGGEQSIGGFDACLAESPIP